MLKITDLLLFYILNWSVAWILTNSMLLEEPRAWVSEWLTKKSQWNSHPILAFVYNKINYLINCIICTSIWTALVLCFVITQAHYLRVGSSIVDFLLVSLSAPFFTMLLTKIIENTEEDYD